MRFQIRKPDKKIFRKPVLVTFADRSLEDEGAWWKEGPVCVGNGEFFPHGLSCILEAEVVHARDSECECDVRDLIAEGANYDEGACMEVCVLST